MRKQSGGVAHLCFTPVVSLTALTSELPTRSSRIASSAATFS
jgi:hypothetical protein